ncbi:hypothetical protein VNO77_18863 [Canavalia gladiata]|uniref:Uncharacterized protein n=1 Tax=Canavalia gladiata TaxID=3824 RepID=A0AAN9LQ11_CANGL
MKKKERDIGIKEEAWGLSLGISSQMARQVYKIGVLEFETGFTTEAVSKSRSSDEDDSDIIDLDASSMLLYLRFVLPVVSFWIGRRKEKRLDCEPKESIGFARISYRFPIRLVQSLESLHPRRFIRGSSKKFLKSRKTANPCQSTSANKMNPLIYSRSITPLHHTLRNDLHPWCPLNALNRAREDPHWLALSDELLSISPRADDPSLACGP